MNITNDDIKYVIVQAGGKGTRMGRFAENKPKCLVPVNDIPIIVNTLNVYKDKKVIIIADYLSNVLETYLNVFYNGDNYIVLQTNESGTAGGLTKAVSLIPDKEAFILTWADLFFEEKLNFSFNNELLVGLSDTFKCRWKLDNNEFINEASTEIGVAGFFVFKDKERFNNLKIDKSLVRGFLSDYYTSEDIDSFYLKKCFEVGEKDRYERLISKRITHRFFNEVKIKGDKVYKKCIDSRYDDVHRKEKSWYKAIGGRLKNIPTIHSINPLIMDKINGEHLWNIKKNKKNIIENYCNALDSLHNLVKVKSNYEDMIDVYYTKAYNRVMEVEDIVRFIDDDIIIINNKECINPFYNKDRFERIIKSVASQEYFNIIHGDVTFSNTLVDSNNDIWFIDPRGSFGSTEIYGDRRYDWAKFYYSAFGNYDSINTKKYRVRIYNRQVDLQIKSNGYEEYSDYIIERSGMSKREMGILHASIWLSLTGYVKEDIDAILYSFYRGCQLWTEAVSL